MNASTPPPNLAEQHAATIARLLVLLDQLLCAIGEQARLPWYARWLVPARAMRPVMAWGKSWAATWIEGLRNAIIAIAEQARRGELENAAEWDSQAGGATRGASRPAKPSSSEASGIETLAGDAETKGDVAKSRRAATGLNPPDDGACGPTPDGTVAQGESPENDSAENDSPDDVSPENDSTDAEGRTAEPSGATGEMDAGGPGLGHRSMRPCVRVKSGWRDRRNRPPDGVRRDLPPKAGRCRAGPRGRLGFIGGEMPAIFHV